MIKIISLVLALSSLIMLAFAITRWDHQYDMHGYYTDPTSLVVYSEQSTEILQIGGCLLLAAAAILFNRSRQMNRA